MPRMMPEIVEQHAEEAAFLWLLRTGATRAPNYDLDDLADLDDRIDAHLEGLHVAGRAGWEVCREALAWREPGEVFAAAHLALRSGTRRRVLKVIDVATGSVELARGFVSALGWFPYYAVEPHVRALTASRDPIVRRIGIAASAVHRRDPGIALADGTTDCDLNVRTRALKATAELGRRDLLPYCREFMAAEPESQFWSGWSAALLGDGLAAVSLWETAARGGATAEQACDLAVRRLSHGEAWEWLRQLVETHGLERLALVAARALGDPAVVPWLIDAMAVNELARPAGEAFTSITGLDLEGASLTRERPEGFGAGPTDDLEDDDVTPDPDEDLPWPEPHALARWWSQHRESFAPGRRYLMGRPIAPGTLNDVLRWGTQRQRAAAAMELVLLHPGQPLFEVRAPAGRQRRALAV